MSDEIDNETLDKACRTYNAELEGLHDVPTKGEAYAMRASLQAADLVPGERLRDAEARASKAEKIAELKRAALNWDSEGAARVSANTLDEAANFVEALPLWAPLPEVMADPRGHVGFEWDFGKSFVLVVTVSGQNRLTYAALLGKGARAHGIEVFNDMVPRGILGMLERAQKGSKQAGAERMERERDESLASRQRVPVQRTGGGCAAVHERNAIEGMGRRIQWMP